MTEDILTALPVRRGHFLLESGCHTDLWLTLDALFVHPTRIAPLAAALADKLHRYEASAVCGPLLGGAFLAQRVAEVLGADFYYTEPATAANASGLYRAEYRLPPELARRVSGARVVVVDDVISAGSSTRATIAALAAAQASVCAIGTLLVLGDAALNHFADRGLPVETLDRRTFNLWTPVDCPLCRQGLPLQDPRVSSPPAI